MAFDMNPRDDEPADREEYEKAMDLAARRCQHVTKTPIYIKSIAGMPIDRSEWENEHGAFFRYDEKTCPYIADEGEKFCPKHKAELAAQER